MHTIFSCHRFFRHLWELKTRGRLWPLLPRQDPAPVHCCRTVPKEGWCLLASSGVWLLCCFDLFSVCTEVKTREVATLRSYSVVTACIVNVSGIIKIKKEKSAPNLCHLHFLAPLIPGRAASDALVEKQPLEAWVGGGWSLRLSPL